MVAAVDLVVNDTVLMMGKAAAASSKREAGPTRVAQRARSNVLEGRAAVRERRAGWAGRRSPETR